jgi:hypothetical protein
MIHIEQTKEAITQEFQVALKPIFTFLGENISLDNQNIANVFISPYWREEMLEGCTAVMSVYLPLKATSIHLLRTFSEELSSVVAFLKDNDSEKLSGELWIHPSKEDEVNFLSFNQWVKSNFLSKGIFQDISHKDFLRRSKYFSHQTLFANLEAMIDYTHLMALRWECWHSSITIGFHPERGWKLMPTHGSAKEMEGLGIINPTAWLMMVAISVYLSGRSEGARQLWQALVKNRILNPENTTPDEGGILTTNNYIRNIVMFLQK